LNFLSVSAQTYAARFTFGSPLEAATALAKQLLPQLSV
jgi:hypothetical protein